MTINLASQHIHLSPRSAFGIILLNISLFFVVESSALNYLNTIDY